jgi:polysaccharide biosynthesis PFTS motif protein
LIEFIRKIISANQVIEHDLKPFQLVLKPKRGFQSTYSKEYFRYLDYAAVEKLILITDFKVNIYNLLKDAVGVIAYPFTSVAYLAVEMNIPVVFFDPTNLILDAQFSDKDAEIPLVSSEADLVKWMSSL